MTESYDYDPWGVLMPARSLGSGTKEKFTTKERDAESQLDYFGARSYASAIGRWTTVDPPVAADSTPQWNPYGYVKGNPVTYSDPFGFCPPEDHEPCNMKTGDPNLDNPQTRNRMERSFKTMKKDKEGYYIEKGGVCYDNGTCKEGTNATREYIRLSVNVHTSFDWHTHGNVGRPRPNPDHPDDKYTEGPSEPDLQTTAQAYSILRRFVPSFDAPSYILDGQYIYRLTPGGSPDDLTLTTFKRWTTP